MYQIHLCLLLILFFIVAISNARPRYVHLEKILANTDSYEVKNTEFINRNSVKSDHPMPGGVDRLKYAVSSLDTTAVGYDSDNQSGDNAEALNLFFGRRPPKRHHLKNLTKLKTTIPLKRSNNP